MAYKTQSGHRFSSDCGAIRNEDKKGIYKAVKENDVETLEELLDSPVDCRLGSKFMPILSVAVLNRACDVIKYLIDRGCNLREHDEKTNNVFHVAVSERRFSDILEILLAVADPNVIQAVFVDRNRKKMTPFLSACFNSSDEIISRLFSMLENQSIPLSKFIGNRGNNVFHFLLDNLDLDTDVEQTRVDYLRSLMEKFPFTDQLIDAKNDKGEAPLCQLLFEHEIDDRDEVIDLAKLFFQYGASPDIRNRRGLTYFDHAIWSGNVPLVEVLLRAGCRYEIFDYSSPLRAILARRWQYSKSISIRMIELLLIFGYDLGKEPFLNTNDEDLIEFASPEHAERYDTMGMDRDIVTALRELRRSNILLSLRRQCRRTIRRQLKVKADEIIGKLTCIPNSIKSFLLVENEQPLLEIMESNDQSDDH